MNKQNEKYKTMLKRKNKEKKIYKDKNASLQLDKQRLYIALRNRDQEIENQHKIIEKLNLYVEFYDELSKSQNKEIERLNNIINELEKYFEQEGFWHSLDKIKELKESNLAIPPEVIGTNGLDGGLFDYGDR